MQDLASNLSQYATTEVITVVAAMFVAWLGWQGLKKTGSIVGGIAKKSSFMGLLSTIMIAGGLGLGGLGVGEISSRGDAPKAGQQSGLSNAELTALIKDENVTTEELKLVIAHAQHRDQLSSLSNDDLIKLVTDPSVNADALKSLLTYVSERDAAVARTTTANRGYIPVVQTQPAIQTENSDPFTIKPIEPGPAVTNQESLMTLPFAWMTALMGVGLTIAGVTCFSCRNARRNPDDPHHFDRQNQSLA